MKAFILVALVASVAARSLDLETLRQVNKDKVLLNTVVPKVTDDLLLKEQQLNKNVVFGQENLIDSTLVPVTQDKTFGGIYDNSVVVDTDRVLTFEEVYQTALFREYLSLPLFKQYIQYPSFQRFVASVYFQRFWQIPAYKVYFINPVLFYKYVQPIVQLFNTEYTLPSTVYGQQEDVLGLQSLVDEVQMKNKNFLPYAYNYNRFTVPTTNTYGTPTNYKFLLEKLYKNLVPQQSVVGEVKTDVKVFPTTEKKVVVEPFTNQVVVEEPKIVDVQVDSKFVPVDTVVPTTVLNEKHLIILKSLLEKDFITREVYEAVYAGKVDFTVLIRQVLERRQLPVEVINQIITKLFTYDFTTVVTDEDVILLKKLVQLQVITPKIVQEVTVGKYDIFTVLYNVIVRRDVIDTILPFDTTYVVLNEKTIAILRDLVSEQVITPEVFQAVLTQKVDFVTVLRQVLQRKGWSFDLINLVISRFSTNVVSTETDIVILKELLKKDLITPEIFQAVIFGKIDLFTVLHKLIVKTVDTTVFPYGRFNYGSDLFNKYSYGYKYNQYNTEIPTIRDTTFNTYNRYPIVA